MACKALYFLLGAETEASGDLVCPWDRLLTNMEADFRGLLQSKLRKLGAKAGW